MGSPMKLRVLVHVGRAALKQLQQDHPVNGRSYVSPYTLVKEIADANPDCYFYWLLGGRTKGDFQGLDFVEDSPNSSFVIEKIPNVSWMGPTGMTLHSMSMFETFSQDVGVLPIHAYVDLVSPCSVGETGWALSSHTRRIPAFYWWQGSGHEKVSGGHTNVISDDEDKSRFLTDLRDTRAATAHCVFLSPQQHELFKRRIKKTLGPTATTRFSERSIFQPPVLKEDRMDELYVPWEEREIDAGYYGRIRAVKNVDFIFSVYETAYSAALAKKITVTAPHGSTDGVPEFFDRRTDCAREDYLKILANTKAMLYASKGEGFGISVLEALMLGVPVVLPKLIWTKVFFDYEDGSYPFFYEPFDKEDALEKLELALKIGGEWSGRVKDAMAAKYGSSTAAGKVLVNRIRELNVQGSAILSDVPAALDRYKFVERAKEILEGMGPRIVFSEFMSAARKGAIAKGFKGRPMADPGEWYAVILALGYQDVGGHDPVFEKE